MSQARAGVPVDDIDRLVLFNTDLLDPVIYLSLIGQYNIILFS